jgi:hypothetical protein
MILVDSNSTGSMAVAQGHAAKMQSIVVTPASGFSGVYNIVSTAQPKSGQPARTSRYTVILRAVTGGYETFCNCEAGTPTHVGQVEKLCKHVYSALDAHKMFEIADLTAKFAAMGI